MIEILEHPNNCLQTAQPSHSLHFPNLIMIALNLDIILGLIKWSCKAPLIKIFVHDGAMFDGAELGEQRMQVVRSYYAVK